MPTTCGFPNCKFRSRYRGADDNRHFYRVPKKPPILRERWLQAIGRTEDTIVNQEVSTSPSFSTSSSSSPHFVNVVVVRSGDAINLPLGVFSTVKLYPVVQTAQPLKLSGTAERKLRTRASAIEERRSIERGRIAERNRGLNTARKHWKSNAKNRCDAATRESSFPLR